KQAKKSPEQQLLQEKLQAEAIKAAAERVRAAEEAYRLAEDNHAVAGNKAGHDLKHLDAKVGEARSGLAAEKIRLEHLRVNEPELDIRLATEALALAKERLALAEKQEKECHLVAPDDGIVVRVLTGRGDVLGPHSKQPSI